MSERPEIAVVLPGGGARGAYEIGALSVLLPVLEDRGESVTIFSGTSVGAINATFLASTAHLTAIEQVEAAEAVWRGIRRSDVMARVAEPGALFTGLRFLGDALNVPGVRFKSLLDSSPLAGSLDGWVDWDALHRNVRSGTVTAACVAAHSLKSGRTVGFVETTPGGPEIESNEEIHYLPVRLTAEHVRASAAIPLVFPPVEVTSPRRARGHYVDGSIRMNNPLKPAIELGADRILVLGFDPVSPSGNGNGMANGRPILADVVASILDAMVLDQATVDVRHLAAVNSFFVKSVGSGLSARAYRSARGRRPYRKIAYALVSPPRRRSLARLAEEVYEERFGGLRAARGLDYALLRRVLGHSSESGAELLSYLFFDPAYIDALLAAGRADAERWLTANPAVWSTDSARDFDLDPTRATAEQEVATLDEWRSLRRR